MFNKNLPIFFMGMFQSHSDSSRSIPYATGFENLGNTCYMNATFHLYSGITELCEYFINLEPKDSLGEALHEFWTTYSSGKVKCMDLSSLREEVNKLEPKFNQPLPQDSQEYVRYIYNRIITAFPDCPLKKTQFSTLNTKTNEKEENIRILKLFLPEGTKKDQKISFDEIVDYNFKDKVIIDAPEYLIVNMVLDIDHKKHCLDLQIDPDNISLTRHTQNKTDAEYEIKCIMEHYGRFTEDGHDTAFMRLDGNNWYYFNDFNVSLYTDMKTRKFGTEYHYLLQKKTKQ